MKKSKIFFVFFIMLAALMPTLLVSCAPSMRESGKDGVYFVDALGRELSIAKKPERVAALIGSFAEVWQLSGGSLCASAEDAWDDIGLDMGNAVNLGGAHSPSLELLLASEPELVLASASTASNVELCEVLESAGIAVIYFDIDNFEDYLEMLRLCTEINDRYDLYEKNGLELKSRIDEIKKQYSDMNIPAEQKRVLLLRASSGFVKAKGSSGTILGEMLSYMGCINIADNDDTILEDLSIESVIASEPYHIFVVTMGDYDAACASIEKMIYESGAWSSLSAVKENRLHIMDKRLFNMKPNGRYAEAYEVLYDTLTK